VVTHCTGSQISSSTERKPGPYNAGSRRARRVRRAARRPKTWHTRRRTQRVLTMNG